MKRTVFRRLTAAAASAVMLVSASGSPAAFRLFAANAAPSGQTSFARRRFPCSRAASSLKRSLRSTA